MISKHENNKSFSIGCIEISKKYGKKLGFATIFNRFKVKGQQLSKYVTGLVSHKMHFNQSINHAADWMNQVHILQELLLSEFNVKTLYRVLGTVGRHDKAIMTLFQKNLDMRYHFESTDSNFDWSSLTLFGNKARLAKRGHSRDGHPGKKQITFGLAEYREPVNVPYALTVAAGNVLDKQHFPKTFKRTLKALNDGSLIILDRGANTKDCKELVRTHKHHYLCASSLSQKVDMRIKDFDDGNVLVKEDEKTGKRIYCLQYYQNNEYKYLYFSEENYDNSLKKHKRRVKKKLEEYKELERKIKSPRKHKKKSYQLQDFVATETLSLQKRLTNLTPKELKKKLFEETITGREGFFLLNSSKNLTPNEALQQYKSRDSIEKLIDSLKNVIRVKPVRVWDDDEIKGILLIGFLAQVIISLVKYEHEELRKLHPKTILESVRNLTLTIEHIQNFVQNRIISNFDWINRLILDQNATIT